MKTRLNNSMVKGTFVLALKRHVDLYADVVRCFFGICTLLSPQMGPGTRVNGTGSLPANHVGPSTSHREGYKNCVRDTVVFTEVQCECLQRCESDVLCDG